MADSSDYLYSYPDILNRYYALGIPSYLGKSAHPLFLALLHKGNQLRWLDTFAVTNEELIHLSALTLSSIKRARVTLSCFRINGKPLVEITEGGYNEIPVYTIHYDLINGSGEGRNEVKMNLVELPKTEKRGSNCAQNKSKTAKRGSKSPQNEPLPNVVNDNVISFSSDIPQRLIDKLDTQFIKFGNEKMIDNVHFFVTRLWMDYVIQSGTVKMAEMEEIAQYDPYPIAEAFTAAKADKVYRGKLSWLVNRLREPERFGVHIPGISKAKRQEMEEQLATIMNEYEKTKGLPEDAFTWQPTNSLDRRTGKEVRLGELRIKVNAFLGRLDRPLLEEPQNE